MDKQRKYVAGYDYLDWIDPEDVLDEGWFYHRHDGELDVDVVYNPIIDCYGYTDMNEVHELMFSAEKTFDEVIDALIGDDDGL